IVDSTAGFVRSVSFSSDSRRLATIGDDGRAKVWDLATARPVLTLRVADQNGMSVSYSPDGLRLVTSDAEGNAGAWDAETGESLFLIRGVGGPLVHSKDGLRVAAYGEGDTVRLWDATGEMQSAVIGPLWKVIYNLAVSPDGKLLATGDGSVWN